MGATTREIFGAATQAEPAAHGTYGVPPKEYRLPNATRLGAVRLQVSDLARSLAFYEQTLGLRVVKRDNSSATLSSHGEAAPIVELEERRGVQPAGRGLLGLYHFAILLPDRPSLGRFVRHLADIRADAGGSDHLVSEAFYITDPDGLGIEIYADRPRETWQRIGRELMISTDPVDIAGLISAAGDSPWRGMPAGTRIGHVHLHVGELAQGAAFYSDVLGFDRMTWRYPGALFLGAGGYHHHLGTNEWAGPGARPPSEQDARLLEWTIEVPTEQDVAAVARSLETAGHPGERITPDELLTRDPWGTAIRVRAVTASEATQ